MGRPRPVSIKTFPLYNKLHTEIVKMYSGVTVTALYPIKETAKFFLSPGVWSFCCGAFKRKKKDFQLNVTLPVITDEKTIAFLEEKCWKEWITKSYGDKESDLPEALALLKTVFPDKEPFYFYELQSIISAYANGTFVRYNEDGEIKKATDSEIKHRKYYTHKYCRFDGHQDPLVKQAYDEYHAIPRESEEEKQKAFSVYHKLSEDYCYKHFCLDSVFLEIGQNAICYPVVFTHNTAEWSRQEYGKLIGYAHAGEIYFVVTPDKIFFQVDRHY